MDYIEYIQIFISLVLGLAFTRIITSYAIIIKNANRIKFYWPYFPLSVALLIFVINDFWTGFERSNSLNVGAGLDLKLKFVAALVTPLSYTVIAELLHPKIREGEVFDMGDIAAARKTGYTLGAISTVYSIVGALWFNTFSSTVSAQLIRLSVFLILMAGIFSRNEFVQKSVSVIFLLMAVAWFLFENTI